MHPKIQQLVDEMATTLQPSGVKLYLYDNEYIAEDYNGNKVHVHYHTPDDKIAAELAKVCRDRIIELTHLIAALEAVA